MNAAELQKHIEWLQHSDVRAFLASNRVPSPWFSAYQRSESAEQRITWFSALAPPALIPKLLRQHGNWDLHIGDGGPATGSRYVIGKEVRFYIATGNEEGIEPLVIHRSFHGIRENHFELAQEFRLYHNLYPEPSRKRFLVIDDNGDESEAVRYADDFLEIRTDLLLEFCAIKQMALAIYVDGFRQSKSILDELAIEASQDIGAKALCGYSFDVRALDSALDEEFEASGHVVAKMYILPGEMPPDRMDRLKSYQEFIIGADALGKPIRHTCDPEKLANNFGKNTDAPYYLTPVFFRAEVMTKYYSDPGKYSVEDGYLRCGCLWGLRMDNDHTDCVMVFLGDLGRDLAETERNYWLSFNIPPEGKKMSPTTWKRGFLAEFADPQKPDLLFKHEYEHFNRSFCETLGWDFFLPLHDDDLHFFTGLRLLAKDNQAEFDSQLIALTKILVDSLNEKEIAKGLKTLAAEDKGIAKLEKFFKERGTNGFEPHVKFLRGLQDLRSKSAAHRKEAITKS